MKSSSQIRTTVASLDSRPDQVEERPSETEDRETSKSNALFPRVRGEKKEKKKEE